MDTLKIGNREFTSRLFVGTGKFLSPDKMQEAVIASQSQMITVAMKRVNMMNEATDDMLTHINRENVQLLPNTSGVRDAREAVLAAQMSREIFGTDFIKLEIHPDPKYLLPDPVETLKATEQLAKDGFIVLPYIQADPVLCKRLEEVGAAAVMPLGAPIGTNKGIRTGDFLEIIIEQSQVPVVIDAGLGVPSHAAQAMEMGADAVLVNTAIAVADDPVAMADAFRLAVIAGRKAYLAGPGAVSSHANASSPLTAFLNK
ncbi:MAG: thiazole synthase [Muribaculaceae bacterium]